ncbi:MAG: type II toxin-antitoxin system RelE/ParE family toxin [Rhizobiaceae bacterium]
MSGWFLSQDADEDLQDIYLYSVENWGEDQARRYLDELFDLFDHFGRNSEMGRLRPELGEGIRSFPHVSHIVYFMNWRSEIAILRVLHGSREVDSEFADFDPRTNPGSV